MSLFFLSEIVFLNNIKRISHVNCLDNSNFLAFAKKLQQTNSENVNGKQKESSNLKSSNLICSTANNVNCVQRNSNLNCYKPEITKDINISKDNVRTTCDYNGSVCIINRPISFNDLSNNDFCKYVLYYDNHPFTSTSDQHIYSKVVSDYLDRAIKCKNEIIYSSGDKNIVVKDNDIKISEREKPNICKEPTVSKISTCTMPCNKTIIVNGVTTIFNDGKTTTCSSSFQSNTITLPPVTTTVSNIISTTLVNTVSTTLFNTVEVPKPILIAHGNDQKCSSKNKIDGETLKNITVLVKEILNNGKRKNKENHCNESDTSNECSISSESDSGVESINKKENDKNSNNLKNSNKKNKLKTLILNLLQSNSENSMHNNLLGWDQLKEKLKKHSKVHVKECKNKHTKTSNHEKTKKVITVTATASQEQNKNTDESENNHSITNEIISQFKKENNTLMEIQKKEREKFEQERKAQEKFKAELEKKEKELEKKERKIKEDIEKMKKEKSQKNNKKDSENKPKDKNINENEDKDKKPEISTKEEKQQNDQYTTNHLVDELLTFINKNERSEEDILKLINLISAVKNNKNKAQFTKMLPTVTVTVNEKSTVIGSNFSNNVSNTKDTLEKSLSQKTTSPNVTSTATAEITTSSLNKNTPENDNKDSTKQKETNKEVNTVTDFTSFIEKIKDTLKIKNKKPYYSDLEIEKLKREVEEKDKELEELREMQKSQKMKHLEEEEFFELKKKFKELSEKRDKKVKDLEKTGNLTYAEKTEHDSKKSNKKRKNKRLQNLSSSSESSLSKTTNDTDEPEVSTSSKRNFKIKSKNKNTKSSNNDRITITATKTVHASKEDLPLDNKDITKSTEKGGNKTKDNKNSVTSNGITTKNTTSYDKILTTTDKKDKCMEKESKVTEKNPKTIENVTTCLNDEQCEKQVNLKSAEITLKDTNTNKNIKINIPMKEINEAILSANENH
ncbi:hypothetical protein EHP00_1042 [Ecytonucleospora hepatopenaei]|uniref:Uncharacterized protein n=1 Tax=Ecytonucleospora hepatopenaei TaxID=646526 RepID=A0A1W0E4X9_9MICR|nr:hypothetical protein EHP00_1042 [Ecytonucleospora hepatopenaei]